MGRPSPRGKLPVQIPLWSMSTLTSFRPGSCLESSDSSMVDEYSLGVSGILLAELVQIPLWSMSTF